MRLTATTHSLELVTSAAGSIAWHAVYNNLTASDSQALDGQGSIATATTATLVAAPAASEQRDILNLFIDNAGTAANTITLRKDAGGTPVPLFSATLQAGETLQFSPHTGFQLLDAQGRVKQAAADNPPIASRTVHMIKTGATTAEAAGVRYWPAKDNGTPGAFVPGTPGMAGRAVDGMDAADAGCFPLWTPTGNLWLRRWMFTCAIAASAELIDLLWINSGIAVTTTGAQTVNSVALPARDANGASGGLGVIAGLLATAATTNAGAIANCTVSYTNQDGVSGRAGTMASWPATAAIGTLVPFELQAGDTGVRSIQSVTLGTSFGGGAVSLVMYRVIDAVGAYVANSVQTQPASGLGNIRLWNGAALFPVVIASAANTHNTMSHVMVEER